MADVIVSFFTDKEFFLLAMAFLFCAAIAHRTIFKPLHQRFGKDASTHKMRKQKGMSADDQSMMQDLWTQLEKMDERMGNIETILLSKVKTKPSVEEEFEQLKHDSETAQ